MATKKQLIGAHGSLDDTLARRIDPGFPPEVHGPWLGRNAYSYAIAQRVAAWLALANSSPGFDAVIDSLRNATEALVVANSTAKRIAALDKVKTALDGLAALLDATGN